jgi:hypothetical protein
MNELQMNYEWTTSELNSTMIELKINYKSTSKLQIGLQLLTMILKIWSINNFVVISLLIISVQEMKWTIFIMWSMPQPK